MNERRLPWQFYEGDPVKWWAQSPPYQPQVGTIIEQDPRGLPGFQIRRHDGKKVYVATNRLELFKPTPKHRLTPPMKEKTKSYPCTERGTWRMVHMENSLLVSGDRLPHIHKGPIRLGDREFMPGQRFIFLGGNKTSAGFVNLDFRGEAFEPIEYVGQMFDYELKDQDSPPGPRGNQNATLALFRTSNLPAGEFWAWWNDGTNFYFGNRACAGRIMEHDRTTPEGETVPDVVKGKGKKKPAEPEPNLTKALATLLPGLDPAPPAEEPEREPCSHCGDGERVPKGYFLCPVCDAEWNEEDAPAAAPGKCEDCNGTGWAIKPGPNCLEGYPCDCGASQEMAPADRVAGWPSILRQEPYPQSVEDVATACLAQGWDADLFIDELKDQFHGVAFRFSKTMDVVDAAGGEDLVRSTYTGRIMAKKSQALQSLLTAKGYSKRGTVDSGITTKGLNLVKNVAIAKGLKTWPECATPADYDALHEAVRAKLEPQTISDDNGQAIAAFTECAHCWNLEFWPDVLNAGLEMRACPKCGHHHLVFYTETSPAFAGLKAALDKAQAGA